MASELMQARKQRLYNALYELRFCADVSRRTTTMLAYHAGIHRRLALKLLGDLARRGTVRSTLLVVHGRAQKTWYAIGGEGGAG